MKAHKTVNGLYTIPKFFIFFLCFFYLQVFLEASETNGSGEIATLFCPKNVCNENDFFPIEPREEIKNAIVRVSIWNICSGIIIKLKKGARECRNPLLLTAGHCVAPYEKNETIRVINHKGTFYIPSSKVLSLQRQCLNEEKTNCLVTPDEILQDDFENEFKHGGVDQALIPLYSSYKKRGDIKPYEIDIEKIANETELGSCFKDPSLGILMISALINKHAEKMGITSKLNPKNPSSYIRGHMCNRLDWIAPDISRGKTENFIKKLLAHRCPTHEGMSGSFMELECKGEKAFFVHQKSRLNGAVEFRGMVKEGNIIYPYQYEDRDHFKNGATQIDSKLLNFYFEKYCAPSSG